MHPRKLFGFCTANLFVFLTVIIVLCSFACCVGQSEADTITVLNPSFDLPGTGLNESPDDWTTTGPAYTYPLVGLGNQLQPQYSQYAAYTDGSPGSFSQIIQGYTIQPNTVYTLQVLVGGRLDSSGYGFGGSRIELDDASTQSVLASQTWLPTESGYPDGGWATSTVSFTTGSNGTPAGDELQISLFGLGSGGSLQTWFDNVSLVATPVPEPAEITLLLTASFGLIGVALHRRWRGAKR